MSRMRSYSDEDLVRAVAASRSWRGVLRELGLAATSANAMRSVRSRADRIGADYSHFTGQRRWTDEELASAIRAGASWPDVLQALGLADGASRITLKGHALRLGLDTDHLDTPVQAVTPPANEVVDLANLRRAGPMIAAAWFTLCGRDVAWPLEPCAYDLLVTTTGQHDRVQVKSTTVRAGSSWIVWLSKSRKTRITYDPGEIDSFFVVDGDLGLYHIPGAAVAGLHTITLSAYSAYRVRHDRGLGFPTPQ